MEENFNDLLDQYNKLNKSSLNNKNEIYKNPIKSEYIKKYGIYIILFIWIGIIIICLQPYYLYKLDENTNKYKFRYKRFFLMWIIIYVLSIIIYLLNEKYILR